MHSQPGCFPEHGAKGVKRIGAPLQVHRLGSLAWVNSMTGQDSRQIFTRRAEEVHVKREGERQIAAGVELKTCVNCGRLVSRAIGQ